jgi:hypothetical protein
MHIKTYLELINEARTPSSICDEYDTDIKSVENKYRGKFLKMIYSILNNYFEHREIDDDMEDNYIELHGIEGVEDMGISNLGMVSNIHRNSNSGIDYSISGSDPDEYGITNEYDSNIRDLNTSQLSELLRGILGSPELIKYYGINSIKKINEVK